MSFGSAAIADNRDVSRDEVHYRARAYGPDARPLSLLIVNISALGLMARCDMDIAEGSRLRVTLPIVGVVAAEIRWCLGGRMGCELDRAIDLADYYELLAVLIKGR
ncbi:PilZ domain-containing protein [Sphingomonas sp. So64.6b]|uniref:PilZ domain-containing protein n=1 Tax=Sphingomonas sp. So64.6b TaxID=2997354 RepID=UPI001602AA7E|nr:PilZ domain-containing protein [Sphingomonas sp. So64.6b]QNA83870.1 PilZ domain-containing protein [Sphingomonas sp. So64.6b]